MTITLSPEVEADIREIMRLWGWGKIECDGVVVESMARYFMRNGIAGALDTARFNADQMAQMAANVPQSVPDARVFEETGTANEQELPAPYEKVPPKRFVRVCDDSGAEFVHTLPDIAEGTEVRTSGGRLLVWRFGRWDEREEGGAK